MKTRLARKIVKHKDDYRDEKVIAAFYHLAKRGEVKFPHQKFYVRCPITKYVGKNENLHEFFRKDGVGYYLQIDISTGIHNYRCAGKSSTRPFGPDKCGLTPVWYSSWQIFGRKKSYKHSRFMRKWCQRLAMKNGFKGG